MADRRPENLLEAARRGEPKAIANLLSENQGRIYRFSMKMCRQSEDAADVLQETLLAMARTIESFRGTSSLSTWAYTIARSFCIKKRRQGKHAPKRVESLEASSEAIRRVAATGPGPDEEAETSELHQALDAAIGKLDPMYREVLVLRDVEGLSARETGEVLELGVPAVKSRLHRARATVRESMASFLDASVETPSPGCPDVVTLLSKKLEGDIDARVCREMEEHVARCKRCDGVCDSLKKVLHLCQTAPEPQVPAAIQASVRKAVTELLASRP